MMANVPHDVPVENAMMQARMKTMAGMTPGCSAASAACARNTPVPSARCVSAMVKARASTITSGVSP